MKINQLLASFFLAALVIMMGIINADAEAQAGFSSGQKGEIESIVHNYLVKNPQVLIEVSKALQVQEQDQFIKGAEKAISEHSEQLFNDKNSPVAGDPNGKVNFVEFFDYQCVHCRTMSSIVNKLISDDKQVRFVFKELPIFGPNSQFASKAALAAQKQGKYIELHHAIMDIEKPLSSEKVLAAAKSVGLDVKKLQADMKDKAIDEQLNVNFKLAQDLGVMGTPAFIIASNPLNGKKISFIPGATSQDKLQSLISEVQGQ